MKKIIVTGCNGQLGRAINQQYAGSTEYELVNTDVEDLDMLSDLFIVATNNAMKQVDEVTEKTKNNTGPIFNICVNYGGRPEIVDTTKKICEMVKNGDNGIPVPNYVDENVSTKIVKLIQSYTGVVNKMVWRKF